MSNRLRRTILIIREVLMLTLSPSINYLLQMTQTIVSSTKNSLRKIWPSGVPYKNIFVQSWDFIPTRGPDRNQGVESLTDSQHFYCVKKKPLMAKASFGLCNETGQKRKDLFFEFSFTPRLCPLTVSIETFVCVVILRLI